MDPETICHCGCEQPAKRDFLPGHDQKLRARLERRVGGLLQLEYLIGANEALLKGEIAPWEFKVIIREVLERGESETPSA